ncbi:MAG: hypothetical protein ABFD64_01830 [Armatimonadota bacterium]
MPWCPKCGSEYQPGITVCADCDSLLVEDNPSPPAENVVEKVRIDSQFITLASICVLLPWFWVFCGVVVEKYLRWSDPSESAIWVILSFSSLFYGFSRRKVLSSRLIIGSFSAAVIIQVLICFILALVGFVHYPWKLFFCVPFAMMLSGIILMQIWVGSWLRGRLAARH